MSRGFESYQLPMGTLTRDSASDAYGFTYPCGHSISIPAAAVAFAQSRHTKFVPSQCPHCAKAALDLKWVDQEEAKMWNADPNWSGFTHTVATSAGSYASINNQYPMPMPERKTGLLAWLEFQVDSVIARAFT